MLAAAVLIAGSPAAADAAEAVLPRATPALVLEIQDHWARIAAAYDLSPEDTRAARRTAAIWVYIHPCEGNPDRVADVDRRAAEAIVGTADVSTTISAAVSEMIRATNATNVLATPRAARELCGFALETATLTAR
jgi:hypothetical protein